MKTHVYLKKIIVLAMLGGLFTFIGCSDDSFEEDILSQNLEDLEAIALTSTSVQAEDYDAQSGIRKSNGNRAIGFIGNNDWIRFEDFDFDGANSVSVRAASRNNGGRIEFRAGGTSGHLLGTVNISGTGSWTNFQTFTASVNDNSNNSDLYLVFKGGSGSLFDVDSFQFSGSGNNNPSPTTGGGSNLALGKTTQQSSTAHSGSSSRAVDGNTSGVWNQGSVTHTRTTFQPWWQVQLGSNQAIGDIKIWNRTNCCTSRLSNFDVFVYNSAGSQVYKTTITSTPNPSVTVNTGGVIGSRVRIKLKGTNPLSLAEVQVFSGSGGGGSPAPNPTPNPTPSPGSGSAAAIIGGMNSDWKLNAFSGSLNIGSGSYGNDGANGLDYEDRASVSDNNNWFFDTNGYAAFKCHVGNPSSNGSGNMRSELRELNGNGNEIEWDGTTGTNHRMRYKVQLRQLPSSGKLCFGQIHGQGDFDDVIRLQLEDPNANRGANNGAGSGTFNVTVKGYVTEVLDRDNRNRAWATMRMDREYDVEIAMRNGIVTVRLDGSTIYTSKNVNSRDNYFKAGAYLQSAQSDKSPQLRRNSNNFGEVWIKNMVINH